MKVILSLLLLSISAMAQMSQSGLLKLDRAFAQATSEKRLDGWMSYMMDSTVVFGPQHSAAANRGEGRNSRLLSGHVCYARFQYEMDSENCGDVSVRPDWIHEGHLSLDKSKR